MVLVEGRSDRAALAVPVGRRGLDRAVDVREMGGATNVRRHLHDAVTDAGTRRVLGLCDEAEADFFRRALTAEGARAGTAQQMEAFGFHTCVRDMATATVSGSFAVVYLVWNTIGNLRTQDEQVECFRNAARHLEPGGRFVVEVGVPALRRLPPGQTAVPFDVDERHLGVDTYDVVSQQATSHHVWTDDDGSTRRGTHHFRYVWPAELDLMARIAGMELERRTADWRGTPFTAESDAHVSVWRLP